MTKLEPGSLKQALEEAGIEIYRTQGDEIHVAERIRLHIMDSGVRVVATSPGRVRFVARAQRADFPRASEQELLDRLRSGIGAVARARGYEEGASRTVQVRDPVDEQRVLDTWYEIAYEKGGLADVDAVIAEVRWALEAERTLGTTD